MDKNRGFAPIVLIIIVVAVLAVAGGGYLVLKKERGITPSPFIAPKEEQEQGELITRPPSDTTPDTPKEESKSPLLAVQPKSQPKPISSETTDPKKLLGIWKVEKVFAATPEGELKEIFIPLPLFTQFREKDLCLQWKYVNNDGVCERYDNYSVAGNIITVSDPTEGAISWEWQIKDEKLEIGQRVEGKLVGKTVSVKVARVFFDLFSQKAEPPKPRATTLSPSELFGEWRLEKFLNYDSTTGQWKPDQGTATEFQEFLQKTMCIAYSTLEFTDSKTFRCLTYVPYTVSGDVISFKATGFSGSKETAYYRWNMTGGKLELSVGISDTPFLKYVYYKNPPPPPPKEPFILTADNTPSSLGAFKEARVVLTSPIKTTDLVHLWITDAAGSKLFISDSTISCDAKACADPGETIDPDPTNPKCPFNTTTITDRFGREKKIGNGICFIPAAWGESGKLESKFSLPVVFMEAGSYTVHARLYTSGLGAQISIEVNP